MEILVEKTVVMFSVFWLVGSQLTGCDSGISAQVEKCVQSQLLSYGPPKDSAEKYAMEAQARLICMKAASGK